MRVFSGFVAALLCLAIYIVIGAYIYPTLPGKMYFAGNFLGAFLLIALVAAIIAKIRKRRVRYDIVFWLMPVVVLAVNYSRIVTVYDTRMFVAELTAAGPGKQTEVLRTSQTNLAAYLRTVSAIKEKSTSTIVALIKSFDDPVFDQLFDTSKMTDARVLRSANDTAAAFLSRAAGASARVDQMLRQAKEESATALQDAPAMVRNSIMKNLANHQEMERELYQRYVAITLRGLKSIGDISNFLLTEAGPFRVDADGYLVFETRALHDRYHALTEQLGGVAADQNTLIKEMNAYAGGAGGSGAAIDLGDIQ